MIESKKYWLVGDNTNKRRIYNSIGELVFTEHIKKENNLVQINATELANGFYLAKISSSNGSETKSFTLKK